MCRMSLCTIFYNKITKVTSVDDMTQMMIYWYSIIFLSVTACKTIYVNVNRIARNSYSV